MNEHVYEEVQPEVSVDENTQGLVDQLQEPVEQQDQIEAKPKKDNSAERNFRELREKTERLERERNEMQRRMFELEQRNAPKAPEPEPEFTFGDDDLVEGKVLKKYIKNVERKMEDYQRRQQEITTETMLKSRFTDFDAVVNEQTIEKLRQDYPEVAASLHAQPDPYTKLSAAYKLIKNLNIYDPKAAEYEEDRAVVQKNLKQPRSAGTMATQTGTTPLQQANDYSRRYSESMDAKIRAEVESLIQR